MINTSLVHHWLLGGGSGTASWVGELYYSDFYYVGGFNGTTPD